MKRFSTIFLVIISILLVACGPSDYGYDHPSPNNGIFTAPDEFYLDWDIPSVRDSSLVRDGHYSMPVYKFETLEELMHLKEIVGMDEIGSEINNTDYCNTCQSDAPCEHDYYNEAFFEYYTLLIGWHQYEGVTIVTSIQDKSEENSADDSDENTEGDSLPEAGIEDEAQTDVGNETPNTPEERPVSTKDVAKYEKTGDGTIMVYLNGEKAEGDCTQQWVFVAVPKSVMADCDSIAFFVELPTEE